MIYTHVARQGVAGVTSPLDLLGELQADGPALRNVPSYVWLQKFGGGAMPPDAAYLSGGFLGPAYAPLAVGTKDHTQDPSTANYRVNVLEAPRPRFGDKTGHSPCNP